VPTLRLVAPILATAVLVAAIQSVARETAIPTLSRRHDDLHRMLSRRGRSDRLSDVPHLFDAGGGRVSMAAYEPSRRRMDAASVTMRRQPGDAGSRDLVYFYPSLEWDGSATKWLARRGGSVCVLEPTESGANTRAIAPDEPAPITLGPALVELTVRQSAALGFSSAEIASLAEAYPDNPRFRLLLHQQWAAPLSTVVLLLLGLPLVIRLGRPRVFRSFLSTTGVVALYYLCDSVLTDVGARGALNAVVAAWSAHVVFGALGLVLMSTVDT
jgi:lipopolysaccharide export LptBFGC system permease protein LptF